MQEKLLTLEDFDFSRTKVDIEEIKKFDSEDQFMSLAVELLKEVGQITAVLSCAYKLDEKNHPKKWTRNEAILGGLMVRICKLQSGLLDQTCQKRGEIMFILLRCLAESLVNLYYLLKNNNDVLYDEYVASSLTEEKNLLDKIQKNIENRGYERPIEIRMKNSIERAFKKSSFSYKQINSKKGKKWGKNLYERTKNIEMESSYFALFGLPSHAVHGNWQDLITYHLNYENGVFSPNLNWGYPRPQPLFAAALLSAKTNKLYLNDVISKCSNKNQINKLLDDFLSRVYKADELHEQFLQKNNNKAVYEGKM